MNTCLKLSCVLLVTMLGVSVQADDAKPLDDLLLESLDNDLLDGLDDIGRNAEPVRPANPAFDDKLLEELGEGQEAELGDPQDPITKLGERMRQAESLIDDQDTSARTQQVQKQITDELAALIAQVSKQCCQGGQCKPGSTPGSQAGQRPGNQPARDSNQRLGNRDDQAARLAAARELLKEVWGHLPPKIREQMMNASVEEFLPKYEQLIEDYYKRLAESES